MNKYLKQLIEARKKKLAEINTIMTKALEDGETPNEEDSTKIEEIEAQVAEIEKNIERVKLQIQEIKDAETGDPEEVTIDEPAPKSKRVEVKSNLEKGMGFTLAVKAAVLASKKGMGATPVDILKSWGAPKEVVNFMLVKSTVGTTTDAEFASALVDQRNLAGEFVELLRPKTIVGRLTGLREVPFNVKIPVQTAGGIVNWVGEAAKKPTTNQEFTSVSLAHSKIAGIVLLSDELIRFSDPKADKLVMDDLQKSIAQFTDEQFLDPAKAEATESPGSILNGVTAITSTGDTAEAIEADLLSAIQQIVASGESLDGCRWIMSETRAAQYALLRDAVGNIYFQGMSLVGDNKSLLGIPVITSQNAGLNVVLVKESSILMADDGMVDFALSTEATIEYDTGVSVNLFQNNLSAIRAERFIRWKPIRTAAAYIAYTA